MCFIPIRLSDFININGKNLKNLDIDNYNDYEFLAKLFQSIAQSCKNLEDLSITYKDELDWELIEVFNNCIKLKSIKFNNYYLCKIDWDKISTALNETLPKNLKSVTFTCEVYNISNHSLYCKHAIPSLVVRLNIYTRFLVTLLT